MAEMNRRTFGKAAFGLSLSALMVGTAGCTSAATNAASSSGTSTSTSTGASGASGGGGTTGTKTLTIGLDAIFTSFDPAQVSSGATPVLGWQAVFDTLLAYKPDGTIVPNAAQSYTFEKNNTVLTMKLRPGMKFIDGTAVDSAAVKASIERMKAGGGSDASRVANVTITTPDTSTVVLTASEPTGLLPTFMCLAPGIIASPKSFTAKDVATNPVGSGPYKIDLANTTSGATWTFVRNETYWNKAAFPYDKVVFKLMTDITARVSALTSGQVNAAAVTSQTEAQVQSSGLTVIRNAVNWAGLHIADRGGKLVPGLGNLKVRQAINMVFDRSAIVKALFQGNGAVSNQIFNDKSDAYSASLLPEYPFDVDKAKALMKETPFAGGFSLNIPSITGLDYANPLITQQLGLLNIKATQVKVPDTEVVSQLLGGKFGLFYFTLESRGALWDIVQSLLPTSIWNTFKYKDATLAPMLAKAQKASGADLKTTAQAINKYITDQAWFAPWALPTNFWALDKTTTATPTLGSTAPYLATFASK